MTNTADMVERVARAIQFALHGQGGVRLYADCDELAKAALEASHHAELVEAIRWTVEQIELCAEQAGAPPRQSMIYLRLIGLLAKIDGDL